MMCTQAAFNYYLLLILASIFIVCSTGQLAPGSPGIVTVPSGTPPASTSTSNPARWCVAKSGVGQTALQAALDYACGQGRADCGPIQPSGTCFSPNTLQNHASYAFNSYYQKSSGQGSSACDFSGAATFTTTNPSTGSCNYPTSSSPTTTTPSTTQFPPPYLPGLATPPTILNGTNPSLGGLGDSPLTDDSSSLSIFTRLHHHLFLACINLFLIRLPLFDI
ncbi:Carbohydrate-binding X8 domain superfamily protein [Striga hermonthica]|uniref:Carbohydrate-binding X8 domain superfamily protein n=1 Tax=Striga hermonthica TaxID=68872 RepID=A0A9N7R7B2_STRHE|nr:Carbohydrate-binding X8 domain superfamily protein [Striga hermonthica]